MPPIFLIHRCEVTIRPITAHGLPKDEDVPSAPRESQILHILLAYLSHLAFSHNFPRAVIELNMQTHLLQLDTFLAGHITEEVKLPSGYQRMRNQSAFSAIPISAQSMFRT